MSPTELLEQEQEAPPSPDEAAWAEKITAAYSDELAGHEQQVGKIIAVGQLLLDAKEAVGRGRWMPFVAGLPFGISKAERRMLIASTPELSNSANWPILPAHASTLAALAKLDERAGEGSLAKAIAGKLIHPDIEARDVDDIAEILVPLLKLSPAEEAAAAPVPKMPPRKSKALVEAETKIAAFEKLVDREITLNSIFVRPQVTCTLCGKEQWLEDAQAQADIVLWITTHVDECHADDKDFVAVRYVIERRLPPPPEPYDSEKYRQGAEVLNSPPAGYLGWNLDKYLALPPAPEEVVATSREPEGEAKPELTDQPEPDRCPEWDALLDKDEWPDETNGTSEQRAAALTLHEKECQHQFCQAVRARWEELQEEPEPEPPAPPTEPVAKPKKAKRSKA